MLGWHGAATKALPGAKGQQALSSPLCHGNCSSRSSRRWFKYSQPPSCHNPLPKLRFASAQCQGLKRGAETWGRALLPPTTSGAGARRGALWPCHPEGHRAVPCGALAGAPLLTPPLDWGPGERTFCPLCLPHGIFPRCRCQGRGRGKSEAGGKQAVELQRRAPGCTKGALFPPRGARGSASPPSPSMENPAQNTPSSPTSPPLPSASRLGTKCSRAEET